MPPRPNILFLMSDEHRADVAGYEGNPVVRTPVLDELARTGVVLRNAYTPSPICIPGRQAMMSGQLPATCGCRHYGEDLPPGYMTFTRRLSQYGYATVAAGKLHHMGSDQMQGWTQRIAGDMAVAPPFIAGRLESECARYNRSWPRHDGKWSDAKEIQRAGIGSGPGQVNDAYAVQGSLNFITEYFNSPCYDREQINPLLLKVSLQQPHYPYFTDERRFNYYLNRVPLFLDQTVADHPVLSRRQVRPGTDVSEREIRRAVAAYYGMVETVDEHFGRVMEWLRHVGQNLDEWIIIYTSDHGEMLGEHGIWEKQRFYEASARVPLVIRWPQGFGGGRVCTENVSLCDLFATLCDLTGIPTPDGLDSRSLAPLLRGDTSGWHNEAISQFGDHVMIKQDHLKYQHYGSDGPEVLFDLERDASESRDYSCDPGYAEKMARFRERRGSLGL